MNSSSDGKNPKTMTELKFVTNEPCYSQQTIVKMLKRNHYRFDPIDEYGNENFYCVVLYTESSTLKDILKKIGFKVRYKIYEGKMGLITCGKYCETCIEPMVFTRDDVQRILRDVPENYVGDTTL